MIISYDNIYLSFSFGNAVRNIPTTRFKQKMVLLQNKKKIKYEERTDLNLLSLITSINHITKYFFFLRENDEFS